MNREWDSLWIFVGEFGFLFFRQQVFFSLCCRCSLALNRIWKSFQSQNVTRKVVALAINTRCKNKWQVALTFNNQASIKFDDLQIFGQEQWKYWILGWIAFCLWVMNNRSKRIDQIASSFSQYLLITVTLTCQFWYSRSKFSIMCWLLIFLKDECAEDIVIKVGLCMAKMIIFKTSPRNKILLVF